MQVPTTAPRGSINRHLLWLFVIATIWKVWLGAPPSISVAGAQLPDSAAQRIQLLQEARKTNDLLSQIQRTLASGTIKVQIEGDDKSGKKTGIGKRR